MNNNSNNGITGAATAVTSGLGAAVGGVSRTVGGVVGAAGRGVGDTGGLKSLGTLLRCVDADFPCSHRRYWRLWQATG